MKLSRVAALMALATTIGLGGPAITAGTASVPTSQEQSALPKPSRRGKRYLHELVLLGMLAPLSHSGTGHTGTDWIRRRTHNFRRPGVGSQYFLRRTRA